MSSNQSHSPIDAVQLTNRRCPECDASDAVVSSDDTNKIYCQECGLILAESPIDHGPEWVERTGDEKRVGGPLTTLRHDRGISASIGYKTDSRGNSLPPKTKHKFGRLRRWNSRAKFQTKKQTNLAQGLSEVRRVAGALELSRSLQEQAGQLFREASTADLLPGLSIEAVAAACVYAICRINRLPRYLSEVGSVARVSEQSVRTAYHRLNVDLELPVPPLRPQEFIPRVATALDLSEDVQRYALDVVSHEAVEEWGIGRNPRCVAAGCLYFAVRHSEDTVEVTQRDLATAADVSIPSLRHTWQAVSNIAEEEQSDTFPPS
ncbi:transcription initiation factor IIB (plasmid) [Halorientalis pallida]|uniref:transcription initiation factor IIB n=1 Tax=Halorientalis pallida TaxID=2479928 RepID=UPI003C6EE808